MRKRAEAVSFVDNVKSEFANDPEKYEQFLEIMRDLKADVYGLFYKLVYKKTIILKKLGAQDWTSRSACGDGRAVEWIPIACTTVQRVPPGRIHVASG